MKKILISIISFSSLVLPVLTSAAAVQPGYFLSIINGGITLLSRALVFLISLAVVWFIWNVVSYAMSDDEEKKGKAKDQMIWGVIAIAVSVSVWGLVNLLKSVFGVDQVTNSVQSNLGNMIPR